MISERMLDVDARHLDPAVCRGAAGDGLDLWSVARSNVSREAAEAGETALQELLEGRFEGIDLLVIYIDGMQFGEHHIISAVGVDGAGHKHVLGIQQGPRKTWQRCKTYCSS